MFYILYNYIVMFYNKIVYCCLASARSSSFLCLPISIIYLLSCRFRFSKIVSLFFLFLLLIVPIGLHSVTLRIHLFYILWMFSYDINLFSSMYSIASFLVSFVFFVCYFCLFWLDHSIFSNTPFL